MRRIPIIIFTGIFMLLLVSCNNMEDKQIHTRLTEWDKLLETQPQAISDSLKTIDPHELSRENRAYYNLLKIISDDKTYINFQSDSLIDKVVNYYSLHDSRSDNYIRSLIYLGIVRTRMGITDSTVYEPLKKADYLFHAQKNPEPAIGYILYYFLGNTHYDNGNYKLAHKYFEETLHNAKQKNDSIHIFDTYLAIYWNEMAQANLEKAKNYVDTLSLFYDKISGKNYFILNAQSVYYEAVGEFEKALNREKEQLHLIDSQKENIDSASLYYVVSDRYNSLNQLDSAMFYGKMAIDNIHDITNKQNYLYYDNVANIAEKQQDYLLADSYRKKAFGEYQKSVKDRLDTQVMELEKKYDLSEAENAALRSRQGTLYIALLASFLAVLLITFIMLTMRNRKKARIKLMLIEHEAERRATEAKLLEEEAHKRDWLIGLYGYISNRLTSLQESFDTLSQRYVSSNPKVYENMHNILHITESDLREIPKTLIPDEDTFASYTNLSETDAECFNTNEKIMLMLLACKADNRQIATFMNTSLESIRARKSQLKKKMTEKKLNTEVFFGF